MALVPLGFETIRGGTGISAANDALKDGMRDCVERPHLKKGRTVTFSITITPHHDADTNTTIPMCSYSVSSKLPGINAMPVTGQFDKDGMIVVNTMDFDNPKQMGIDEVPNIIQMQQS